MSNIVVVSGARIAVVACAMQHVGSIDAIHAPVFGPCREAIN